MLLCRIALHSKVCPNMMFVALDQPLRAHVHTRAWKVRCKRSHDVCIYHSRYPGLAELQTRVLKDLQLLNYPARPWVRTRSHPGSGAHVYDVVVVGGGQCGLATAFGLRMEKVRPMYWEIMQQRC
eukprot:GHUV01039394.1.p1 GENE.GHUV01039394.1~~GHUV01039394.1.p1  ORF type:complete len:125 (+),score=9.35 GHUV01039394.1:483-857(+)